MDLLRSVYRRAVQIPLDNLEQIWREWDAFENSLNKLTVGVNYFSNLIYGVSNSLRDLRCHSLCIFKGVPPIYDSSKLCLVKVDLASAIQCHQNSCAHDQTES
jgi:hypothetical protein